MELYTNTTQRQMFTKYTKWLLQVGEGSTHHIQHKSILSIPDELTSATVEQVIDHIYGNLQDNLENEEFFKTRSILAPTNSIINRINQDMLKNYLAMNFYSSQLIQFQI